MRILSRIRQKVRSSQGFTFVEVLAGIYIIAFGLVGALLVFSSTNSYMTQIRQNALALHAVQEKIESIRSLPFDSIALLSPNFTPSASTELPSSTGTLAIGNPFADSTNIVQVTATVSWKGPNGRDLSKSLNTYVTRSGLNKQ